jgi:hypothetical protein
VSSDLRRRTDDVLRRVEKLGYEVRRNGSGHVKVYDGDRLLVSMASTPSDHRSVRNTIATLRRAGIDVRQSPRRRKGAIDDRQTEALRGRLVAVLGSDFTLAELSRHAMETARRKGIRSFRNEHSAQVTLAGLRDGRRVSKWVHDLVAATLNDIESVDHCEPEQLDLDEIGRQAEGLLGLASSRRGPDMTALAGEWDIALDSLARAITLVRAATRRTFEELGRD